jgi:hypothetical protein
MENNKAIFTEIYQENVWGSTESVSGSGSQLSQTLHLRNELPVLLHDLSIRSFLDLPCGDCNWMNKVDLGGIDYIGGDIVAELVDRNRQFYRESSRRFKHLDIVSSILPRVDAILCRDCLVHLPLGSIFAALKNICSSGAFYLLTTHFSFRTIASNHDISTGGMAPAEF